MGPTALLILSFVASHSSSDGISIQQCEVDASYFGMTDLSSLMRLKFILRLLLFTACHRDVRKIFLPHNVRTAQVHNRVMTKEPKSRQHKNFYLLKKLLT